ncbi:MAG: hypothetical protein WC551_12895 [Patescibacteria group bacterium]
MKEKTLMVPEDDLVTQLGVTQEYLKDLRKKQLTKDEDYCIKRSRIWYSSDGVKKLKNLLHLGNALELKEIGEAVRLGKKMIASNPCPTGAVVATVKKIYQRNPRFLEADIDGKFAVIRCRENRNFVAGMKIEKGLTRVNERLWDFVGRLPRGRGIW